MLIGDRFRPLTTASTLSLGLLVSASAALAQRPETLPPPSSPAGDLSRPADDPRLPDDPRTFVPQSLAPTISNDDIVAPGVTPLTILSEERTRQLESEILSRIGTLTDPLERSLALERLAQTRLRARELDDAYEALEQAAQATLEAPPGLRRDLRIFKLVDTLLDNAAVQIIEGLSSAPLPGSEANPGSVADLPPALETRRTTRLDQARAEWTLAYRLARSIEDANYQCEAITRAAYSQSLGSEAIARAGLRGSLLPLAPDLPRMDLLKYADELLVEAAGESTRINRKVWRDRSLLQVTANAAEAWQLSRARSIAASIPDPSPRSEALVRTAERLVMLAYTVQAELPGYIDESLARFSSVLASSRATIQNDLRLEQMGSLEEANFALMRKQDALQDLFQATVSLDQRVELLTQLVHNAEVARTTAYPAPFADVPLRRSEALEDQLRSVLPRITNLKNQLRSQIQTVTAEIPTLITAARAAGERTLKDNQDPYLQIARTLPDIDDQRWIDFNVELSLLTRATIDTARESILPEATEVYNLAALAVAQISADDPRSDAANLLVSSLIATNRFRDARAAVALVPGKHRQLLALGEIAEAQGRRGLADSAYAWIDAEARPEDRATLMRKVEEGVLATVDENLLRRALGGGLR